MNLHQERQTDRQNEWESAWQSAQHGSRALGELRWVAVWISLVPCSLLSGLWSSRWAEDDTGVYRSIVFFIHWGTETQASYSSCAQLNWRQAVWGHNERRHQGWRRQELLTHFEKQSPPSQGPHCPGVAMSALFCAQALCNCRPPYGEQPGTLPFQSDQWDLESHTKIAEPLLAGSLNDCREQSLPLTWNTHLMAWLTWAILFLMHWNTEVYLL